MPRGQQCCARVAICWRWVCVVWLAGRRVCDYLMTFVCTLNCCEVPFLYLTKSPRRRDTRMIRVRRHRDAEQRRRSYPERWRHGDTELPNRFSDAELQTQRSRDAESMTQKYRDIVAQWYGGIATRHSETHIDAEGTLHNIVHRGTDAQMLSHIHKHILTRESTHAERGRARTPSRTMERVHRKHGTLVVHSRTRTHECAPNTHAHTYTCTRARSGARAAHCDADAR